MRFTLLLSSNIQIIPFNHLHKLTGTFHKWVGPNNALHSGPSLYTFGWLRGGRPVEGGLNFPAGAEWTISVYDDAAARQLIAGILEQPNVFGGLRVERVQEQPLPEFTRKARFLADGAILTRMSRNDGSQSHLTWEDPDADLSLTRTLRHKLSLAGLTGEHLNVHIGFDRTWASARTKIVSPKPGVKYRVSECPVIVQGTPEALHVTWHVGAGELTGMGLGALRNPTPLP